MKLLAWFLHQTLCNYEKLIRMNSLSCVLWLQYMAICGGASKKYPNVLKCHRALVVTDYRCHISLFSTILRLRTCQYASQYSNAYFNNFHIITAVYSNFLFPFLLPGWPASSGDRILRMDFWCHHVDLGLLDDLDFLFCLLFLQREMEEAATTASLRQVWSVPARGQCFLHGG